ncbi:MAG TPA: hypothetical protein VFN68_08090 [Acidimicrobiales bacterium]|nr:hypothetical protein [Acidimicrobiales bacterium]
MSAPGGGGPTGTEAAPDRPDPDRGNGAGPARPARAETVPAPARALLRSSEAKPDGRRLTLYSLLPGPDRR